MIWNIYKYINTKMFLKIVYNIKTSRYIVFNTTYRLIGMHIAWKETSRIYEDLQDMKCAVNWWNSIYKRNYKQNFSYIYMKQMKCIVNWWKSIYKTIKDFSYLRHISFAAYIYNYIQKSLLLKNFSYLMQCAWKSTIKKSFRIYDTCINASWNSIHL